MKKKKRKKKTQEPKTKQHGARPQITTQDKGTDHVLQFTGGNG
jgi:hypothetical protein